MTIEEIKRIAADIAQSLTDARNAGDGEAYAEAFTDDAVFVNVFGEILMSRQQMLPVTNLFWITHLKVQQSITV